MVLVFAIYFFDVFDDLLLLLLCGDPVNLFFNRAVGDLWVLICLLETQNQSEKLRGVGVIISVV